MAINRFSQGPIAADVQSDFIPLPIDLIDRQIQRRQSQYDLAKSTINETQDAVYGVRGLTPDSESLKGIVSGYDEDIQKAIGEAGGDYSRLSTYSDVLANKVGKDIKSGHLGAIQNNFIKAQNHMQLLSDELKKGNISQAGYNKGMSTISGFGGTVEDGKGGYTRASFYQPTKYLELGKTADEYGTKIRDQYDRMGRRYINGRTASGLIEQNMWNNPQALANAEEQVWNRYSSDPNFEANKGKYLQAYIKDVSRDSGNKLAFQQIHKYEGTDETTGGSLFSYDIIGAKPESSKMLVGGEQFDRTLQKAKDEGDVGVLKWLGSTALKLAGKFSPTGSPIANMEHDERMDRWRVEGSAKVKKAVKEIAKSDLARDIAKASSMDIDWDNPELEDIEALGKAVQGFNTSNANTRIVFTDNKKENDKFQEVLKTGGFLHKRIQDVETGTYLTPEEKALLLAKFDAGEKNIAYSGSVSNTGVQPYGPGTQIFRGAFEDGSPRKFAIIDEKGGDVFRRTEEGGIKLGNYGANRAAWAAVNGISSTNDGYSDIIFKSVGKTKNGTGVQMYVNGKREGGIIEITR